MITRLAATIIAVIATSVIARWAVRAVVTEQGSVMNPLTALMFIATAIALVCLDEQPRSQVRRMLARAIAVVIVVLALVRLTDYASGRDTAIDLILFRNQIESLADQGNPRMAATSAFGFLLTGLSIGLYSLAAPRATGIAQLLALATAAVALLRVAAYAFGATNIRQMPGYASMAQSTALAFLALAGGLVAVRPRAGLMRIVTGDDALAARTRRLLLAVLIAPLTLGWLALRAQTAGYFDPELGTALMVDAMVVLLVALIWSHAAMLDREQQWRTAAEGELRASEERFRSVAETATDAIITADDRGRITFFNPGAERIFGYPATAMLGHPLTTLMPERFHGAHEHGLSRVVTSGHGRLIGSTVELVGRRSDRSEFPIELSLGTARVHERLTIVGVLRDITARRDAHDALSRQREQLQEYIDSMSTMSAKIAPDGMILLVNRIAEQASGLPADALMRTNFLDGQWWAYDPDVQRRVRKAFHDAVAGQSINYEEKLSAFGQVLDVNFSLTPVRAADGHVAYVIAEARDISVLHRTRDALAKRTVQLEEINRELESFSYSVAHDLRAPLRAIAGFSRALEEDHAAVLTTEGRRLLDVVRSNARQMGQLIEDLLVFARVSRTTLSTTEVDMDAAARSVIARVSDAEPTRLIDFVVGPMLPARGDPALLRQVLLNLVENAAKFTRGRTPARIEIGSHTVTGENIYHVRDNGVGFDMRYAPKLFTVFKRLHRAEDFEGTGVGLAIVQRVVNRHGGRVWADAVVDQGATFQFALPREGGGTDA